MKLGSLMLKQAAEPAVAEANRRSAEALRRRLRGDQSGGTKARDGKPQQSGGPMDWLDNIGGILGQLMDKIMSSEVGRSIVGMISPELARSWQAGQTAEQKRWKPPEAVRPGELAATSADDPRHAELQKSLQQPAGQQSGQTEYAGMKDLPTYANAQDRFGNFYHQTEDGLVYRRVADKGGSVRWTYMPQLSR